VRRSYQLAGVPHIAAAQTFMHPPTPPSMCQFTLQVPHHQQMTEHLPIVKGCPSQQAPSLEATILLARPLRCGLDSHSRLVCLARHGQGDARYTEHKRSCSSSVSVGKALVCLETADTVFIMCLFAVRWSPGTDNALLLSKLCRNGHCLSVTSHGRHDRSSCCWSTVRQHSSSSGKGSDKLRGWLIKP
jgi:hypothetical protein